MSPGTKSLFFPFLYNSINHRDCKSLFVLVTNPVSVLPLSQGHWSMQWGECSFLVHSCSGCTPADTDVLCRSWSRWQSCSLGFSLDLSTAAINFLRSLLEPDPAKRPNIQQALANRWLNENYPGRAPPNVTYPNRYSGQGRGGGEKTCQGVCTSRPWCPSSICVTDSRNCFCESILKIIEIGPVLLEMVQSNALNWKLKLQCSICRAGRCDRQFWSPPCWSVKARLLL